MMKILLIVFLFPAICQAQSSSSGGMYVLKTAAVSTYVPYTGANKAVNTGAYRITTSSSITAGGGFVGNLTGAASLNVLKSGDTMTGPLVTGALISTGPISGSTFTGSGSGLTAASVPNAALVTPVIPSSATLSYPLSITGNATTATTATTATNNVLKAGDTMTGPLTVGAVTSTGAIIASAFNVIGAGHIGPTEDSLTLPLTVSSSVTFQSNAFSVGGGTLVISQGFVGIDTNLNPTANTIMHISPPSGFAGNYTDLRLSMAPTGLGNGASAYLDFGYPTSHIAGRIASVLTNAASDNADLWFGTELSGATAAERMRITSSGNVGIGTTAPTHKLNVAGSIQADGGLDISSVTVAGNAFSVGGSTLVISQGNVTIGVAGTSFTTLNMNGTINLPYQANFGGAYKIGNYTVAADQAGNQTVMTLNSNWTTGTYHVYPLGIGLLPVATTMLGIKASNKILPSGYYLQVSSQNATSIFSINGSGNVGIGTTSPLSKLTVSSGVYTNDGAGAVLTGYALCFTADHTEGHCTTIVGVDGTCTCTSP